MTLPPAKLRLSGTNLERAADHNQRITLHAIRVNGSLTRAELAAITGLTAPAIANIAKRLFADGLIEEAGQRRGSRGQPPTRLVVNREACHSIGINIDRDHITIVLVNFVGETLARVSQEIDFALPDEVRALYRRSIKGMMRSAGVREETLVGLGVAVPDELGSIDLPGRPPGYEAWDDFEPAALFGKPLDVPIFVENDAAAAAMGEMQLGHGQRHSSFFYVLISSGLGGGLVIDGSYFRGADGRSGELGLMHGQAHIRSSDQVQDLVSLSGLASHLDCHGFDLGYVFGTRSPTKGSRSCVNEWIELAALELRAPLEAINCLINPAAVLVGGRLPSELVDRLAARAHDLLQHVGGSVPAIAPVIRAELSEDAPAVGAAILPFSHFLLPKPAALWKAPSEMPTNSTLSAG